MSGRERRRPSVPSPNMTDGSPITCPRCRHTVAILTSDGIRARQGDPLGVEEQVWGDGEGGLVGGGINVRCSNCGQTSRWDGQTGEPFR